MAPYTTLANIKLDLEEKILIELTDDNNNGTVDTAVVDFMIKKADSLINMWIRGRYPTDASIPDPNAIETISTELTVYYLYSRKQRDVDNSSIQDIYTRSIQSLKEIQSGDTTPFEPDDEPKVIVSNKTAASKTFSTSVLDRMPCQVQRQIFFP